MLSLSSTLEAAQIADTVTPYVRLALLNRRRGVAAPRYVRWYTGSETPGPTRAAGPTGALLRARLDPGTSKVYVSRVANPDAASNYSAWTELDDADPTLGLGLSARGNDVILAYNRGVSDGFRIAVRTSTDGGATWSSVTTAAFLESLSGIAAAILSDGTEVVVWSGGATKLDGVTRNGGLFTTSITTWAHAANFDTIDGLAAGDASGDFALAFGGVDTDGNAGVWSTMLGFGIEAPPNTWTTPQEIALADLGTDVSYSPVDVAAVGAPIVSIVERYTGTGAFEQPQVVSGNAGAAWTDGAWRDPVPITPTVEFGIAMTQTSSAAFRCTADGVWGGDLAGSTPLDVEPRLLAIAVDEEDGRNARVTVELDNSDGGLDAEPRLLIDRELEVGVGAVTPAGNEAAAGRAYNITAIRHARRDGARTVTIEATDAWGVAARFYPYRQVVIPAGSLSLNQRAIRILARAGLAVTNSDESPAWTTLTPAVTVATTTSGATAFAQLLARTSDHVRTRSGRQLTVFDPGDAANQVTTYAYGGDDEHPIQAIEVGDGVREAGWVRVFGAGLVGQAFDEDALDGGAPPRMRVDETTPDAAGAGTQAAAVLQRATMAATVAVLTAHPNGAQEVGDTVEVTDPLLGPTARKFRVRRIEYRIDRGGRRPRHEMRLHLGDLA